MSRQHQTATDLDLELPWERADGGASAGKRSMTQGLSPRPIIFRVESAEAARELGAAFGPRDRNGVAAGADAAVDRAAGGSGAPLPAPLRERFESSLGADLSAVRVHTGDASAEASAAVGARAYTVGNDIHFGAGQYQPEDPFGMHLIAHEVAHTQQQAGSAPHRQHKLEVSTPGDSAEVEADRAADAMIAGQPASVGGGPALAARQLMRAPTAGQKTGAGISTKGITFSNETEVKLSPVSFEYATVTPSLGLSGSGELEWADPAVAVGGGGSSGTSGGNGTKEGGGQINWKVYEDKAKEEAFKKAKESWTKGYGVTGVDLVGDLPKVSKEGTSSESSASVGLSIKFANGQSTQVTVQGGIKDGKKGVALAAKHTIPVITGEHDLGGNVKLKGNISASIGGTLEPNWANILKKAAQKGAETAAETAAPAAAGEAATGLAALEAAALVEIAGAGALAASVVALFVIGATAVTGNKQAAAEGERAISGYVGGYVGALTGKGKGGGHPAAAKGQAAGEAKLASIVATIKARPELAQYSFSDAEIRDAVTAKLQGSADTIWTQVERSIRPKVAKQMADARYREQMSHWYTMQSDCRRDGEQVSNMLGVPGWTPPADIEKAQKVGSAVSQAAAETRRRLEEKRRELEQEAAQERAQRDAQIAQDCQDYDAANNPAYQQSGGERSPLDAMDSCEQTDTAPSNWVESEQSSSNWVEP